MSISEESRRTGNLLSEQERELTDAVERSQHRDERVTVEVEDVSDALASLHCLYGDCAELGDSAENDGAHDVWAEDPDSDGMIWRLRLVPAAGGEWADRSAENGGLR